MPKLVSSLVHAEIKLLNPLLKRIDLKAFRAVQEALGNLGAIALTGSVTYEEEPFDEFDAAWAIPKDPAPGKAILYLYGGAYTSGGLTYSKRFGGVLADVTGRRVLCVGYRVAPEHPYPTALHDALTAYRRLLISYKPEDIAFAGESAGGGLCFCLCLKLKEQGLPQPSGVVALSPWTDLTNEHLRLECESEDAVLSLDGLTHSASLYAGDKLREPTVSPVFGDLTGLPDSMIFAGDCEILLNDSTRLAEKLRAFGCKCTLHIEEGMWHAYVLYGIPEAKAALEKIRAFLCAK
jgi:acetyl esterase/lipase